MFINKKRIIIFSLILVVIIFSVISFYSLQRQQPQQIIHNEKSEALEKNKERADDPALLHIRKVLNSYLNGSLTGAVDSKLLVNGDAKLDKENFLKTGLKNFSKDYYKSKFIVFKKMSGPDDSTIAYLEFIDKPDKVFTAAVFKKTNGSYELAYFGQNEQVTSDKIKQLNTQYSFLLEDKSHAL